MATQQNRPNPPCLAFLTALTLGCALIFLGWDIHIKNVFSLLCGVPVVILLSYGILASARDVYVPAAPVLCLSVMLAGGKILWGVLPGNGFVRFLLICGIGLLSYLFLRLFLRSLVDLLWALALHPPLQVPELETWRMLLYSHTPLTGTLVRHIMVGRLKQDSSARSANLLATAWIDHPDPQTRLLALRALGQRTDQAAIDVACAVWATTRHSDLAELLTRKQWRASTPPETLTLSALLSGDIDFLRQGKVEWIPSLAQAALDTDPLIAERAGEALRGLENVEAREALCRAVIEQENPPAQAAALSTGYLPREEQPRALFLFLTEQWERYASHDFDRRLMRLAYLRSPAPLQERIRAKLRASGRIDFLPIIAGEDSEENTAQLNAGESEVLVQTLIANRDWAALWPRALDLPFQWSVRAVDALSKSGWKPTGTEEQALLAELTAFVVDGLLTEPPELQELVPVATMRATVRAPGGVNAVAFSPDRPILAIGTGRGKIVLLNYQTARRELVLTNFEHPIGEIAFSPEGILFCAERRREESESWYIHAFTDVWNNERPLHMGTNCTALAPVSGSYLLSAGSHNADLWDIHAGRMRHRDLPTDRARDLRLSPDKARVLVLGQELSLLSLPDLQDIARARERELFSCATFAPDGRSMFVGTASGQLLVYRQGSEQSNLLIAAKDPATAYSPFERVQAVEVLKKLSLIMSVSAGGEIRFFSLNGYAPKGCFTIPGGQITSLSISPDGSFLAVVNPGNTLMIWDLRTLGAHLLLKQSFAQADLTMIRTLHTTLGYTDLSPRTRKALQFAQAILRHRFRYTIEVDEAPSIAMGEFDIEID